jgi:hypothetical protein
MIISIKNIFLKFFYEKFMENLKRLEKMISFYNFIYFR